MSTSEIIENYFKCLFDIIKFGIGTGMHRTVCCILHRTNGFFYKQKLNKIKYTKLHTHTTSQFGNAEPTNSRFVSADLKYRILVWSVTLKLLMILRCEHCVVNFWRREKMESREYWKRGIKLFVQQVVYWKITNAHNEKCQLSTHQRKLHFAQPRALFTLRIPLLYTYSHMHLYFSIRIYICTYIRSDDLHYDSVFPTTT